MLEGLRRRMRWCLGIAMVALLVAGTVTPAFAAVSQQWSYDGCTWQMKDTSSVVQARNEVRDINGQCRRLKSGLKYIDQNDVIWTTYTGYTMASYTEATSGNTWAGHHQSWGKIETWEHQWWQTIGWIW